MPPNKRLLISFSLTLTNTKYSNCKKIRTHIFFTTFVRAMFTRTILLYAHIYHGFVVRQTSGPLVHEHTIWIKKIIIRKWANHQFIINHWRNDNARMDNIMCLPQMENCKVFLTLYNCREYKMKFLWLPV